MTNVEFLNENFGTDYKGWMKCAWPYNDEILVWMVRFDGSVSSGWYNKITSENTVEEFFVKDLSSQLVNHKNVNQKLRLAVDKSQNYKILGLYKYDTLNSNERTHRIWKKIANSITEYYNH